MKRYPGAVRAFRDVKSGEYFTGYWYDTLDHGWQVRVIKDKFVEESKAVVYAEAQDEEQT